MFRNALAVALLFAGLAHGAWADGDYMAVASKAGSFEDVGTRLKWPLPAAAWWSIMFPT